MKARDWKAQGPCAFCDHPYAAHRLYDSIIGRQRAGEELQDLLWDHLITKRDWRRLCDLMEKAGTE